MSNGNKPAMPFTGCGSDGMTKRETIAMHVLSGIAGYCTYDEQVSTKAKYAVKYADALLKELEK